MKLAIKPQVAKNSKIPVSNQLDAKAYIAAKQKKNAPLAAHPTT
jgi:hypothetical protein